MEDYLISVISSEMSATSSLEMLKAHAVISRSWLLAQIEKGRSIQSRNNEVSVVYSSAMMKESSGMTGKIMPILMYVPMIIVSVTRELHGHQPRWSNRL